jgi:hypothetical protein
MKEEWGKPEDVMPEPQVSGQCVCVCVCVRVCVRACVHACVGGWVGVLTLCFCVVFCDISTKLDRVHVKEYWTLHKYYVK